MDNGCLNLTCHQSLYLGFYNKQQIYKLCRKSHRSVKLIIQILITLCYHQTLIYNPMQSTLMYLKLKAKHSTIIMKLLKHKVYSPVENVKIPIITTNTKMSRFIICRQLNCSLLLIHFHLIVFINLNSRQKNGYIVIFSPGNLLYTKFFSFISAHVQLSLLLVSTKYMVKMYQQFASHIFLKM